MLQAYYSKKVIASLFLTLVLLILGSFIRFSDVGFGCDDWPNCYGKFIANNISQQKININFDTLFVLPTIGIRLVYAYLASILGVLVLWIVVSAAFHRYKSRNYSEIQPLLLPVILFLLTLQMVLDIWGIMTFSNPMIMMTTRLTGDVIIFSLLWLLYLRLAHPQVKYQRPFTIKISLLLVMLQIILGGLVSANYAALSCNGFPGCYMGGQILPDMNLMPILNEFININTSQKTSILSPDTLASINMTHRIGALILTTFFVLFLFKFRKNKNPKLRTISRFMIFILIIQILLGITNVYSNFPLITAVAHDGAAVLLLMTIISLWYFSGKNT